MRPRSLAPPPDRAVALVTIKLVVSYFNFSKLSDRTIKCQALYVCRTLQALEICNVSQHLERNG